MKDKARHTHIYGQPGMGKGHLHIHILRQVQEQGIIATGKSYQRIVSLLNEATTQIHFRCSNCIDGNIEHQGEDP